MKVVKEEAIKVLIKLNDGWPQCAIDGNLYFLSDDKKGYELKNASNYSEHDNAWFEAHDIEPSNFTRTACRIVDNELRFYSRGGSIDSAYRLEDLSDEIRSCEICGRPMYKWDDAVPDTSSYICTSCWLLDSNL